MGMDGAKKKKGNSHEPVFAPDSKTGKTIADAFVGAFSGLIDNQEDATNFKKAIAKTSPQASILISSDSYKLPKSIISEEKTIRDLYIKFSTDWFDDLVSAIYKHKHRDDEDAMLAEMVDIKKDLSTYEIFEKVHQVAKEQIDRAVAHYKPSRLTFIMIAGGEQTDAIIGSYAILNKMPMIQFNQTDSQNIANINDRAKRVRAFAKIISDQVFIYKKHKVCKKDVKISPNKAFDLDKC